MTSLPGGHSKRVPPDPIPNSEVKTLSADDSVGFPHVKVGHRQASLHSPTSVYAEAGLFYCSMRLEMRRDKACTVKF